MHARIENGKVAKVITAPTAPGYEDGAWWDFSDPEVRQRWLDMHEYVPVVEVPRPEDTEEVRYISNFVVSEEGEPMQEWIEVPNDPYKRSTYVHGVKVEEWDDETRTYTQWDLNGNQIESRPYTETEDEEATARGISESSLLALEARIERIEAHLWPPEPDPEPDPENPEVPPPGIKTFEDWGGVWPNQTLLLDDNKVYRNISGTPLTNPPSAFPGGGTAWIGELFEIVIGAQPETPVDPDPDPTTYPAWKPWDNNNESLHQIGDRVTHNGRNWEATVGNNHWEPGVYGWKDIGPA